MRAGDCVCTLVLQHERRGRQTVMMLVSFSAHLWMCAQLKKRRM